MGNHVDEPTQNADSRGTARCRACDGERVLWLMSEFPVPCPDCNPNSPEYKARMRQAAKATGASK